MDKLTINDWILITDSLKEYDNSSDELLDKILTIEDWDLIIDSLVEFDKGNLWKNWYGVDKLVDKIKMLGLNKHDSDSESDSDSVCYANCGDPDCASNY
jgi:hypothetical protein